MDPLFYYSELLNDQPIYIAEPGSSEIVAPSFLNFESRILSLQRNWQLNKAHQEHHIKFLKQIPDAIIKDYRAAEKEYFKKKASGEKQPESEQEFYEWGWTDYELIEEFENGISSDIDYFPEYLRRSTISFLLSLLENFLLELSIEIAHNLNIEVNLSENKMPFINKYLNFFIKNCGLQINLDKTQNKALDAIREVRNRFIHNLDRAIPAQIQSTIQQMSTTLNDGKFIINDDFVDASMREISNLVKDIEISYLKFRSGLIT